MTPPRKPTVGFEPQTPAPVVPGLSSEDVREIVRDEMQAGMGAHQNDCQNTGPVCRVWTEIGKMETRLGSVEHVIAGIEGAQKATSRTIKIVGVAITLTMLLLQGANYLEKREENARARAHAAAVSAPYLGAQK